MVDVKVASAVNKATGEAVIGTKFNDDISLTYLGHKEYLVLEAEIIALIEGIKYAATIGGGSVQTDRAQALMLVAGERDTLPNSKLVAVVEEARELLSKSISIVELELVEPKDVKDLKQATEIYLSENSTIDNLFKTKTPQDVLVEHIKDLADIVSVEGAVVELDNVYSTFFVLPYYTWFDGKCYPSIMRNIWDKIKAEYIVWAPIGTREIPISSKFIPNLDDNVEDTKDGGSEVLLCPRDDLYLGEVVSQIGGTNDVCIVLGGPWESLEVWIDNELQGR